MKRLFTMIVLVIVLVGFSVESEAGVKKIRPDQLKPRRSTYNYYQYPNYVRPFSSECIWIAMVKLPVGKRITKLAYYHKSSDFNTSPDTSASLIRVKMGEISSTLAFVSCTDNIPAMVLVEDTSIYHPRIKSGYTYYVRVSSANDDGLIYGIKIFYN